VARKFYEGALGLKPSGPIDSKEVVSYQAGNSTVLVYRSQYAGTNKATAVTWPVNDVEGTAEALKAKGVTFEHYQLPGASLKGDVHITGRSGRLGSRIPTETSTASLTNSSKRSSSPRQSFRQPFLVRKTGGGGPTHNLLAHRRACIQNFTNLLREDCRRERFLQERESRLQHASAVNYVVRVPGHI
jgi:hypothetical protein